MHRRSVIGAIAGGLLGRSLAPWAQAAAATKAVRVGVLRAAPDAAVFRQTFEQFRQALRESAFVEGTNLALEYRVRAGNAEDIGGLATELVRFGMDAIVAIGPAAVRAAALATKSIPIVAVDLESDPVAAGFVTGLARPGGNVTGLFLDFPELSGKWIELLREMVPGLSRIAVAWDPATPPNQLNGAEAAARTLRVQIVPLEMPSSDHIQVTFRSAIEKRAGGMLMLSSPMFYSARAQIVDAALKLRMPTMMPFPEFAEHGGLMAYGPSIPAMYRQAGHVMVRILRGTRPANIPIERPARFELILNRVAAAGLGLTVPQSLLLRADKVVQ